MEEVAFNPFAVLANWLKDHLSARYSSILSLVCCFIIWAPERLLSYLSLLELSHKFRWLATLVLLLCSAVVLVTSAESAVKPLGGRLRKFRQFRYMKRQMEHMAVDQLDILFQYADQGRSSIYFQSENGAAVDLLRRGFLYNPTPHVRLSAGLAFALTTLGQRLADKERIQRILAKHAQPKTTWRTQIGQLPANGGSAKR